MQKNGTTPLPTFPSAFKIIFDPSVAASSSTLQQLNTTPISHISCAPNAHPTGALLDVNRSYILYTVKNGLVRVIDRRSALRSLLRGHDRSITDICFFGNDGSGGSSDVLGTVGGENDGSNVLIWRIFSREAELASEKMLEIRFKPAARIVWHPFDPNQFLLIHRKFDFGNGSVKAVATLVESTRLVTVAHESETHAGCSCGSGENKGFEIDGALQLVAPSSVNDLCWSGLDARHVLTAHDDGCVRLWDLRTRVHINNAGEEVDDGTLGAMLSAKCLNVTCVSEESDESVNRCLFLHQYDDASAMFRSGGATAMEPGSYLTAPFLTGSKQNSCIHLWSPFTASGSPPEKVRVFEFGGTHPSSYIMALCKGPGAPALGPSEGAPPPSTFVLLADTNEGNLYALHLHAQWRERAPHADKARTMAAVTGFDYIIPFRAVHPIYSWSILATPMTDGPPDHVEMGLFCVQSKAVQLLTLTSSICAAPPPLDERAALPGGVSIEKATFPQAVVTDNESIEGDEEREAENFTEGDVDTEPAYNEEFEDYDVDEEKVDEESEDSFPHSGLSQDDLAPPASALPPPGLGMAVSNGLTDPFANWLGNLAKKKNRAPVPPPPPPSTPATPYPSTLSLPPGLTGFAPLPLSIGDESASNKGKFHLTPMEYLSTIPKIESCESAVATPTGTSGLDTAPLPLSTSNESDSKKGKFYLTPMECSSDLPKIESCGSAVATTTATSDLDTAAGALSFLQNNCLEKTGGKSSTHNIFENPKPGGTNSSRNSKGSASSTGKKFQKGISQPIPAPAADGKIVILKRANKSCDNSLVDAIGADFGTVSESETNEAVTKSVSEYVKKYEATMTFEIQRTVRNEMQTTVIPVLSQAIEDSLERVVLKPMKSWMDQNAKDIQDTQAKEVADIVAVDVKQSLICSFYQTMREVMIPGYEASTQQMFAQISSSIDKGFESQLKAKDDETLKRFETVVGQMEAMTKAVEVLSQSVARLQADNEKNEHSLNAQNKASLPSVKDKILSHISAREFENAFTLALTGGDAGLAVFACKSADFSEVLGGEDAPKLSQPILLCLMQQLSFELPKSNETDAKVELDWLQDIALSLDPTNGSIINYVGDVCAQLIENINAKMAQGAPTLRRPLQMLLKVIRGIKNS